MNPGDGVKGSFMSPRDGGKGPKVRDKYKDAHYFNGLKTLE